MKIGILGGTFDPLHQGHLQLARAAKTQYGLDKVIFMPAFIPPHKAAHRDLTPAPYRLRMVQLAVQGEAGFEAGDLELNRPEISYTVDTLRALEGLYPKASFYLILGADAAAGMRDWKEPEEIFKRAHILAAARPGFSLPGNPKIQTIKMPSCDLASTALRAAIGRGERPGPEQMPEAVAQYLFSLNLYHKK